MKTYHALTPTRSHGSGPPAPGDSQPGAAAPDQPSAATYLVRGVLFTQTQAALPVVLNQIGAPTAWPVIWNGVTQLEGR